MEEELKSTRIYHQKQEHKRDAKVKEELNSIGKSSNSTAGSSSNSSKNPYSEKPKENFLTKPFSKAHNSQKGDKTPAKHDTVTTEQTKRGRTDSESPAPVKSSSSSSSDKTLPKKGTQRWRDSPSKLL